MTVATDVDWTVVVEVDRDWYALKGALAEHPCPPSTSVDVALSSSRTLIGRTSTSRGLHPEIALDADTGVSRRHAQLVCDADQLSIVDLSSTNGTYVVPAGDAPLAAIEPLVPGVPVLLAEGDRIYVGAWSRLTVRAATS